MSLPRTIWKPSGARLVPFKELLSPFQAPNGAVLWQGSALRTTITGKDGDDSQRANRVLHACGTQSHNCYLWIQSVPAHIPKKMKIIILTCCSAHHSFRTHHAAVEKQELSSSETEVLSGETLFHWKTVFRLEGPRVFH